ncbi:glycosyltransferase family 2 protein [Campylobacter aviculae]|uniref:Glycosyltransferase family 2 protein n=2 Tax=Campylobacter aviculae TaxID=2510190 RepID=A0A4U7BRP9_9BACT|nr:glycosyltransferase family 2 protein [Campylobacter aviculae]TKX33050.1 glycosyltransferase family 2 protein [Campylobacter aviculae]
MPQISIILPTYNVELYIARALQSCINQTFKDIEIIIVDDCGNDKSIEIAKEYAKKDERIKIIHNEKNLGTFASRNQGVLNSNSPYIMFLDPDDYLELNACEVGIFSFNQQMSDLVIFNFKMEQEDKSTTNTCFSMQNINLNINQFLFLCISEHLSSGFFNSMVNKIYKKKLYIDSLESFFKHHKKISIAEDVLTNFLYFKNSKSIYLINQALYCYCFNPYSITREKRNIERIQNSVKDLIYVANEINLASKQVLKEYFLFSQIIICNLNIHKLDLTYKYLTKNFLKKLALKLKRKVVKIKRKKYIKLAKDILKEANVSSSF